MQERQANGIPGVPDRELEHSVSDASPVTSASQNISDMLTCSHISATLSFDPAFGANSVALPAVHHSQLFLACTLPLIQAALP